MQYFRRQILAGASLVAGRLLLAAQEAPSIVSPWQTLTSPLDLGRFATPRQEAVDFAIWQALDGTWQIWSCIRNTAEPGNGRLFHRWQGKALHESNWEAMGVVMRADPAFGERPGSLQAPFVMRRGEEFRMHYSSGGRFFVAHSYDGKTFARYPRPGGGFGLFANYQQANPEQGFAGAGGRDIMLLRHENRWLAYYTASADNLGKDYVRTSSDLWNWDTPRVVAFGGEAGTGAIHAECPFVYQAAKDRFYLFRTQKYKNEPMTRVYRSADPFQFGVEDDRYLVARLPIAAPEILTHEGVTYVVALLPDLSGMRIARIHLP
ncbi:MAG: hypothetical protein NW208_02230 [Bryobacter sp.]|nr:hypothetical protein [Bryobacter sp.]